MSFYMVCCAVFLFWTVTKFRKVVDKEDRQGSDYVLAILVLTILYSFLLWGVTYFATTVVYMSFPNLSTEVREIYKLQELERGMFVVSSKNENGDQVYSYKVVMNGKMVNLKDVKVDKIVVDEEDENTPRIERVVRYVPKNAWTKAIGLGGEIKVIREKIVVNKIEDINVNITGM